jgi:PBP1b-binding outer membrane lipoprotein LpoB
MKFMRFLLAFAVIGMLSGCRDEVRPPTEDESKVSVPTVKKGAEDIGSKPVAPIKNQYPDSKLPEYLEKTKDMPAGMAKAREVQREMVAAELEKQAKALNQASVKLSEAEKKARIADPKLGLLYKELIDKQIEYRKALEGNKEYAAAKKQNAEVYKKYQQMLKRQKDLIKKEKLDDK